MERMICQIENAMMKTSWVWISLKRKKCLLEGRDAEVRKRSF